MRTGTLASLLVVSVLGVTAFALESSAETQFRYRTFYDQGTCQGRTRRDFALEVGQCSDVADWGRLLTAYIDGTFALDSFADHNCTGSPSWRWTFPGVDLCSSEMGYGRVISTVMPTKVYHLQLWNGKYCSGKPIVSANVSPRTCLTSPESLPLDRSMRIMEVGSPDFVGLATWNEKAECGANYAYDTFNTLAFNWCNSITPQLSAAISLPSF